MKNINSVVGLTLVLFALFCFTACSDESENNNENLVQGVEIKEIGQTLSPNDLVHITGSGFELSDQILLNFYWETGDKLFPEGSLIGYYYTEITAINENAITLKLPYRMPASRVEVMLIREGNMQKLGEVKMTDGQTPKEYRLYGVYNNSTQNFTLDMPEQIATMMSEGLTKWEIETHPDFHSVVNATLTYGLCGLANDNGIHKPYFFDFCTSKWTELSPRPTLAIASIYGTNVVSIENVGDNGYSINNISSNLLQSNFLTRSNYTPIPQRISKLPADLKPEYFGQYPAAQFGNTDVFLLSANKGNNKWIPVRYSVTSGFAELDEIDADALIPFCFYIQKDNKVIPMSGYIISSEKNGSQFCLVNEDKFELQEPFTTFPNKALSVTSTPTALNTFTVHFLAYREGNITESFDYAAKKWNFTSFCGSFDEIVWAN